MLMNRLMHCDVVENVHCSYPLPHHHPHHHPAGMKRPAHTAPSVHQEDPAKKTTAVSTKSEC